ncbi:MAG TPA: DUF6261 family protein [Bacteroidales bacterium]
MEINALSLNRLRNEEHYDFGGELVGLMEVYSPATLSIEALWPTFVAAHAKENSALEVIRKSALTGTIAELDQARDTTFRGLSDLAKANCNHFDVAKREKALRLEVVFGHYGNLSVLPYGEETASIENLCEELESNYADELATFGLTEWVTELKAKNLDFKDIRANRFTESANKNDDNMKEVRLEADAAYKAIVNRINAGIVFNGPAAYEAFVNELNQRIESYKIVLAQRRGRTAGGETADAGESNEGTGVDVTPNTLP